MAAPSFIRFIEPPSESEPCADTRDERRRHALHVAERRPRREVGARRCGRVQQIEDVEVEADPPPLAQPEILVRPEVQDVEGGETLAAVRLETNRPGAVLRDWPAAVRIRRPENIRALPFDPSLALQEAGDGDVVRQPVGPADIASPAPCLVEGEELV